MTDRQFQKINYILTFFICIMLVWSVMAIIKAKDIRNLQKLAEDQTQGEETLGRINKFEDQLKDGDRENDFDALFQIAFDRETLGDHDGAIKYYKEALKINQNNALARWNLANIYKELKNKEKAEEEYKKAIKLEPKNMLYYNGLGELYRYWEGNELEEPAMYLKTLESDKENISLMRGLIDYFRYTNDTDNLRYWLNEVIRVDENADWALNELESL